MSIGHFEKTESSEQNIEQEKTEQQRFEKLETNESLVDKLKSSISKMFNKEGTETNNESEIDNSKENIVKKDSFTERLKVSPEEQEKNRAEYEKQKAEKKGEDSSETTSESSDEKTLENDALHNRYRYRIPEEDPYR